MLRRSAIIPYLLLSGGGFGGGWEGWLPFGNVALMRTPTSQGNSRSHCWSPLPQRYSRAGYLLLGSYRWDLVGMAWKTECYWEVWYCSHLSRSQRWSCYLEEGSKWVILYDWNTLFSHSLLYWRLEHYIRNCQVMCCWRDSLSPHRHFVVAAGWSL